MLGLSGDEFYELTPRQYHLLLDQHREQHRERVKHSEWLTGVVAAAIANWSIWSPEKTIRPTDFPLPMLRSDRKLNRSPRLNRKKIEADIRAAFEQQKQRMNG